MLAYAVIEDRGGASGASTSSASSAFASAAATALTAAQAAPAAPQPPSVDALLRDQHGIDLSTLEGPLADAVRSKVSIGADGKLNVGGLYYNGLGDDLSGRLGVARDDLTTWIPQGGYSYEYGESGTRVDIPLGDAVAYAGGYGGDGDIVRLNASPEAALRTVTALAAMAQNAPVPPSYLTAAEAAVFDRLISGTGDYNWARMDQKTLTSVIHSLRANPDGSLNMSAIFGGGLGYDPGVPSDQMAVSRELRAYTDDNGQPTGQYFYYVDNGGDNWSTVMFTPPDPSVGTIVMEERGGGGDSGYWTVPIYKPSDATIAKYTADLKTYNESFGLLNTNGLVQVRPNGQTLNIGNENGYHNAGSMGFHPAFGLYTSISNIKPEDEGGFWGFVGDFMETVVPMVIGAVFSYFGGPIGSFVFSYVMSDGDLDKALTGAALNYVTGGMGGGAEGGVSGLAGYMGVENAVAAAAINGGAASAIGAAANGGDLDAILTAGVTGAATGALGSYITAEVRPTLGNALGQAVGSGVAGVAGAILTGGDVDNAAMAGIVGVVAAGAGQAVVAEGFADSSPQMQAAIGAGTAALVSGAVLSTITGAPAGVVLGQAVGAGLGAAIRTPESTSVQTYPVREPGPIEVRPLEDAPASQESGGWEWYDNGLPAEASQPAPTPDMPATTPPEPQDVEAAAPQAEAPAAAEPVRITALDSVPVQVIPSIGASASADPEEQPAPPVAASNDNDTVVPATTGWEWYDNGDVTEAAPAAPVETETETAPAQATETRSAEQPPEATPGNDNATGPGRTGERTITVGTDRSNRTVWAIARSVLQDGVDMKAQIGQILSENNMANSNVRPGRELNIVPATRDNYTDAELAAFRDLAQATLVNDNARIAEARQAVVDAQAARAAAHAGVAGGSAPLPYTVPGAGNALPVSSVSDVAPARPASPGFLTRVASLVGADSLVIGGTVAPKFASPWDTPAALVTNGGYFALTNSEGTNYFRGIPIEGPSSLAGGLARGSFALTRNDSGDVSAGPGWTWATPKMPLLGVGVLGFLNYRSEERAVPVTDAQGNSYSEWSGNLGWAVNAQDVASGAASTLSRVLNAIPLPQTRAAAVYGQAAAVGLEASKTAIGSGWVGAAYQVRVRFNDTTGEFAGVYTPQGERIDGVNGYLNTRIDRFMNALNNPVLPSEDLMDYRLVGP